MLRSLPAVLLLLLCSLPAAGEVRSYAGAFTTNWKTIGHHGHDQPWCGRAIIGNGEDGPVVRPRNCNRSDLLRGNLDNSIGFRFGRERDVWGSGRFAFVGALEAAFSDTEYNLSQNHVTFFSATALAGGDVQVGTARLGGRLGTGPFATTDGYPGYHTVVELSATVPLRHGAALRLSSRSVEKNVLRRFDDEDGGSRFPTVRVAETSILLVASPQGRDDSSWDFLATAGASNPGQGVGNALNLRRAAYVRLAALRDLAWRDDVQLELSWTASAHESTLESTFLGYPGNERGKTIDAFGIGLRRSLAPRGRLTYLYGAGLEIADWSDEHELLVRFDDSIFAGREIGLTAAAAARLPIMRHAGIEAGVEHVYWPKMGLSEVRWGFGLVLTR